MRSVYGFLAVLVLLTLAIAACTRVTAPLPRDELVVAVRDSSPFAPEEGGGFERDLVELFAQELGLRLRVIPVRDYSELTVLLREGKAHFAASPNISENPEGIRYTQPLREAEHLLVQSADALGIDDIDGLVGKEIEVLESSPQAALLKLMNVKQSLVAAANAKDTATVRFLVAEQRGLNGIDLLERVSEGKSELAAIDSLDFSIAASFFPNLQVAQKLEGQVRFAWAFPVNGDPLLFEKAQRFIARVKSEGTLARLNDRYFGHLHRLDQLSISWFLQRVNSTLPRYRAEFVAAQEMTGIDWRLLAALAYQESMWNPLATSPTNVRGMMMLTEETADRLKVSNRLDARQSIRAGARYLNDIIAALPAEIPQPDRTWMGIAAYNLGQGHMNGALAIARSMERDTTSWYEMKQVLPLMARPEYYRRLKSGRARGGEAVIMVENIRKFYDILSRFEPQEGLNLNIDRYTLNASTGLRQAQARAGAEGGPSQEAGLVGPALIKATQLISRR
ncbi:putative soluble lytic transglycosylase fused to an ABC-type amino acid-binding protein [Sterolibacterium denitrificans]|uniref:Soluble lytic transglycosylase fused to an ABC-type amino acid-binding protein n=1 Tax=Sterolibacterium denitrificans TaxID=157592 RepID=A0A7Z7MW33_9PROT|nr:membrane-bound lytic murein transglycosylase MltF [Sterolibacterium denitrificans]SMB31206.1 putative soluble lytic transglycosylase fused to an ABC-type amino acid-binding protein [Sterolibacterium denitrificans]